MLEFPGLSIVLSALSYLYWVLAIAAFVFAIYKGKDRRSRMLRATIVLVLFGFLPGKALVEQHQRDAYAKEAWAYFKKMCDEKSGEKIYKTFTGVKSVVVIKPLPPATEKDLYDQFWYGDPYSNATPWKERGEQQALRLTGIFKGTSGDQVGLEFVEFPSDTSGKRFYVLRMSEAYPYQVRQEAGHLTSRFAVSWDDISTPADRRFWVAGSRLRIIDLRDQSVVAERVGYFIESGFGSQNGGRRPWLASRGPGTTCPPLRNGDYEDRWFVLQALVPSERITDGK